MSRKGFTKIKVTILIHLLTILVPSNLFPLTMYDGGYDETGFQPNRIYLSYSPHEFINPYSGNLTLSHKDVILPGNGGLDLTIQRNYNSKVLYLPPPLATWVPTEGAMGIGWDLHFGRIAPFDEPFLPVAGLTMPDGSIHLIYNNNHQNISSHVNAGYVAENFATLNFDESNEVWTMTLIDGTIYTFDQQIRNSTGGAEQYFASSIKDKNGNEIKIEYYDCCNFQVNVDVFGGTLGTCPGDTSVVRKAPHIKQITDSVGRVIKFNWLNDSCRSNTQSNVISSIDLNGKIYNYTYAPVQNTSGDGQVEDITYALIEVKPPDGPSWTYNYESDGVLPDWEIKSVKYPSGGVVEYAFDTFTPDPQQHIDWFSNTIPLKTRAITSRKASGPNITPGTWVYSYGVIENKNSTTVNEPCGNKVIYKFHGALESSYIGHWAIMLLDEKKVFDSSNSLIQFEKNTWNPYQMSANANSIEQGFFFPLLASKTISRDGNDYVTNFTYNTFYAAPTKIEELGELTRTTNISYFENISSGYYIVGKPLVTTLTDGVETKTIANSHDAKGNLISEDKYGVSAEFSYLPDGNLAWEKNARGFYTHFDRYSFGIAGRIGYGSSNASGSDSIYSETRTINWEGTIGSLTNGMGYQTSFSYDGINRLTGVTPPASGEAGTLITYDNIGGRSYKIKKGISEVQYNFDGLGRPIGTQSNVGVLTEKRYDQCGRNIYESLPFSFDGSTPNTGDSFTYDALDRVTKITHPDSSSINYSYSGNNVTISNERNINTTFNFNSFGDPEDKRLISIGDSQHNITSYAYNLLGNIVRVDSPLGGDRVFTYNSKNFLVSETNPENGTTTYVHDAIGNVTSKTDSKSQTTQYQYDGLNRLILVDHQSGEDDVTYQYDNANNRTLMQSSLGGYSYSYQYDGSDRLTKQVVNLGSTTYIIDFVYDERNNLIRAVYPSGEVVNYNYDPANRLLDIYDPSNILFVSNILYHASGSPDRYINANYVSSDFTFDNRHRLKTIKISRPFPELKVIKDGLGKGTVKSDPLGIDCGNDCSQIYPADGITVTLTATPDPDSNFVAWGSDPDCSDGTVLMDADKTCVATFALKTNQFTLTVNKAGTGTGTVTSSPAGIDCGSDCTENYDANAQVTLTPIPDANSNFTGWSGDADCSDGMVTMDASKTCTGTFGSSQFTLTLSKSGSGSGTVSSNPEGINCGSDCSENYDATTSVTLTAAPAGESKFVAWTGDADCTDGTVTMDANKTCSAQFSPLFTLTIQKNGTGSGTVISVNYGGISCGNDCSEGYDENVLIELDATPDAGSTFAGWSGNPDCSDRLVTMDVSKTCKATFNLLPSGRYTLSVNKEGNGFGTITSSPAGINCGSNCIKDYNENTQVTLTAVPIPGGGSIFAGWSGDPDCSDGIVTMDVSKACTATFTQSAQQFHLSIHIKGFGEVQGLSGFPFQNEVGIDCTGLGDLTPFQFNNDCEEDYEVNTEVEFKIFTLSECPPGLSEFCTDPEVDYNSTFLSWEGDPDCLDGEVTMDAHKTCIAIFTPLKLDIFTSGLGTVLVNPQGNTCTTFPNCSRYYQPNAQVALTPVPNAGSVFSGWSEDPDCSDGIVTMDADKKCRATFTTSSQQFTLTVGKSGNGTGTVNSNPSGINCGGDCTQDYAVYTQVTISAVPDAGSVFDEWSGDSDCSDGVVSLDSSKSCTATFSQSSNQVTLTVTKAGTGTGTITSSPAGIDCGSDCTENYAINTVVSLTVIPDPGSRVVGWDGDPGCNDQLTLNTNKNCIATFESDLFILTVNKSGVGAGTVTSNPVGIDCGSDCSENYPPNTQINLTAVADAGFVFAGWTGDDEDCSDGIITIDFSKNCTATFGLPSAHLAYVTNEGDNSVSVIDTSSNIVVDTINVGDSPVGIAISPDDAFIYVANQFDDSVSVVDTSINSVIATINVGFGPRHLAVSLDGTRVYVVSEFDNSVSVIDTSANTVVNTIPVGDTSRGIAINPDGTRVYVTSYNFGEGIVSVIDTSTNTVINRISVGVGPEGITVSPDGNYVYVANSWDGNCSGCNSVSVIDTLTNSVANNISVGNGPWSLSFNPDGTHLYVAHINDDIVSVINTAINSVINTLSVGSSSSDIAVSPGGDRLYLVDDLDDLVSIVDVSTGSVVDTVNVGDFPVEIVIWGFENVPPEQFVLTVTKTGNGTVTSSPPGVDCGSDCTENYNVDTQVTLTATPDAGASFSGWSGDEDCSDGVVTMEANKTCTATFTQQFTLTVTKTGNGTGTVTSNLSGINCGSDCTQDYASNTEVTLTATPSISSGFTGWSGDPDCSDGIVTMDANKTCTATFGTARLVVSKTGTGTGAVTSNPAGINCGSDCTQDYASNTEVTLTATPSAGSNFNGWSGDPDCSEGIITMDVDKTCTATFNKPKLTVTKNGTGTGTVTSSPSGISCGTDCNQNYNLNTQVTLTATPSSGNAFIGWSGDPDCSDGVVAMNSDKTCTASFNVLTLTVTKTGTGSGTVKSTPTGISCGTDCTQNYNLNTQVALTATPSTGSVFGGWSGDPDCSDGVVIMNTAKTCTATFTRSSGQSTLTVTKAGTGTGSVTSSPSGINCGSDCNQNYNTNTQVTLTATPSSDSVFKGWSGNSDCTDGIVTMNANKTCTAAFNKPKLTVTKKGTGTGTVTSSPAGINCGSDCNENYSKGTQVTLTATPSTGSSFAGWSGNADCLDGVVMMDVDKTCSATFNKPKLTVTKNGTGTGTVTSSPTGINCGSDCNQNYNLNTQVTLTATPSTGSIFANWSGNADCSDGALTMNADKTCTATFNQSSASINNSKKVIKVKAEDLSTPDQLMRNQIP